MEGSTPGTRRNVVNRLTATICAIVMLGATVSSCAGVHYGGMAYNPKDGTVMIAVNDGLLFGHLRAIYFCQVGDQGLSNCFPSTVVP